MTDIKSNPAPPIPASVNESAAGIQGGGQPKASSVRDFEALLTESEGSETDSAGLDSRPFSRDSKAQGDRLPHQSGFPQSNSQGHDARLAQSGPGSTYDGQAGSATTNTTQQGSQAPTGQQSGATTNTTQQGSQAPTGQQSGATTNTTQQGSQAPTGQQSGATTNTTQQGSQAPTGQQSGATTNTTQQGSQAPTGQQSGATTSTTTTQQGSQAPTGQQSGATTSTTTTQQGSQAPTGQQSGATTSTTTTQQGSQAPTGQPSGSTTTNTTQQGTQAPTGQPSGSTTTNTVQQGTQAPATQSSVQNDTSQASVAQRGGVDKNRSQETGPGVARSASGVSGKASRSGDDALSASDNGELQLADTRLENSQQADESAAAAKGGTGTVAPQSQGVTNQAGVLNPERAEDVAKLATEFYKELGTRDLSSIRDRGALQFKLGGEAFPGTSVKVQVEAGVTVVALQSTEPDMQQFLRDAQGALNRELGEGVAVRVEERDGQSEQNQQQEQPELDDDTE